MNNLDGEIPSAETPAEPVERPILKSCKPWTAEEREAYEERLLAILRGKGPKASSGKTEP
jgi:hypothetical protein